MTPRDGPNLSTYVETRFNLLDQKIKEAKELFDKLLEEQDRRYEERHRSNQTALDKVAEEMNSRFASVNEFRGAMEDAQRKFMPRPEAEVRMAALESKLDQQFTQLDRLQAERQGIRGGWGYAVGVLGLVIAAIALITTVMRFMGSN
jgi:hypothetical protein